jgi:lysophospholipase L1-like esterase
VSRSVPSARRYVALGSSFAAGPGLYPLADPGAGRSSVNYPGLLAGRLGLDLVDVTAAGATIDHVRNSEQVLVNGERVASQLAAVTAETNLVTLTVGGNDIQYLRTLWQRSARADPDRVPAGLRDYLAAPVPPDVVVAGLAALPSRLVALLDAIASRAPDARRIVVDYLTVVGRLDRPGAWTPMNTDDLVICREIGSRLEAATALAAKTAGVELVGAGMASREHGGGAVEPWVGGWAFGDLAAGGTLPYHPNEAGMQAVADIIATQLS